MLTQYGPWAIGVVLVLVLFWWAWSVNQGQQRGRRREKRRARHLARQHRWDWMVKLFGQRARRLTHRSDEGD